MCRRRFNPTGHDADTYYPCSTSGSRRCLSVLKYWTLSLFSDLCILSYSFSWPLMYACANNPLIRARPTGHVSTINDRNVSRAVEENVSVIENHAYGSACNAYNIIEKNQDRPTHPGGSIASRERIYILTSRACMSIFSGSRCVCE